MMEKLRQLPPVVKPRKTLTKKKRNRNRTNAEQKEGSGMSVEGIARMTVAPRKLDTGEDIIDLDDSEGTADTKASGTQPKEEMPTQLGARGITRISMRTLLFCLMLLAILPRATAFTELLQQTSGNWASQMLAQIASQVMKEITTSISDASEDLYRSITGGCDGTSPNLALTILIIGFSCFSYCFTNPFKTRKTDL